MRKLLLLSLLVAATCAPPNLSAAANAYQIQELRLAPGVATLGCIGWINGAVGSCLAGTVYESGVPHAAVSDISGAMVMLDVGFANGVNSTGTAVGYVDGAVLWDAGGSLTRLLLPDNTWFSQAHAINNAGQITGYCAIGSSTVLGYAVLWSGGQPVIIGEGCGTAINSSGSVAGYRQNSSGVREGFVWTSEGGMSALAGGTASEANALNDLGQAAGMMCNINGGWACVWDDNGSFRLLDNLPGAIGSTAYAINNAGAVAGSCETPTGIYAVLWEADGSLVNLGMLPGHMSSVAYGLSDAGRIAGCSVDELGMPHAVVWIAAPEPGSALALAAGLTGLLARIRRRQ